MFCMGHELYYILSAVKLKPQLILFIFKIKIFIVLTYKQ